MTDVWVVTAGDKHEGGEVLGVFEDFVSAKMCGMSDRRGWSVYGKDTDVRVEWGNGSDFVLIEQFKIGIDREQANADHRKLALAKLSSEDRRVLGLKDE